MAVVFAERFEDGDISDWTLSGDKGSVGLVTHPVRNGYGLQMTNGQTGSSNRLARRTLSQAYTPTAISLETFIEARGTDDVGLISFWKSAGVGRLVDIVVARQASSDSARRCLINGTYTVTFALRSWIRIELTNIDYVAETFDLELFENGVSVYSASGVAHSTSGCDEIGMFQMGNQGGDDDGSWVLDNVLLGAAVDPDQPAITGSTPSADSVVLTGDAFSDSDSGDEHRATRWQIDEAADGDYADPKVDTGDLSRAVHIAQNTRMTHAGFSIGGSPSELSLVFFCSIQELNASGDPTSLVHLRGPSGELVRFFLNNNDLRWGYDSPDTAGANEVVWANIQDNHWADEWILFAIVLKDGEAGSAYLYGRDGSQLYGSAAPEVVGTVPAAFTDFCEIGYETGSGASSGQAPFRIGHLQVLTRKLTTAELATLASNGLDWSDADLVDGYRFEDSLASYNGSFPTWAVQAGAVSYPSGVVYPDEKEGVDLTSVDTGAGSLATAENYIARTEYQEKYSGAWSPWSANESFATNLAPNQPTITSVVITADRNTNTVTITSSAFSDPDAGATHRAAQWQIRLAGAADWSSPVYDSGEDQVNLEEIALTDILTYGLSYEVRKRDQDQFEEWGAYSDALAFDLALFDEVGRPTGTFVEYTRPTGTFVEA